MRSISGMPSNEMAGDAKRRVPLYAKVRNRDLEILPASSDSFP